MRLTKKLRDNVLNLLVKHPILRDNYEKLAANIWHLEFRRHHNMETATAKDFLTWLGQGRATKIAAISRTRRGLQEEFVELRGNNYEKRQAHQKLIKQDLKLNFKNVPKNKQQNQNTTGSH